MFMSILVIIENCNSNAKFNNYPIIQAATFLNKNSISLLVIGCKNQAIPQIAGVNKVFYLDSFDDKNSLAETLAPFIAKLGKSFTHILAPASTFGKNVMPRVAALLGVSQISNVTHIIDEHTFVQPIYAGNVLATVKSLDPIKVLTIQTTAFPPTSLTDTPCPVEVITLDTVQTLSQFINRTLTASIYPQLDTAKIVIGVGRGVEKQHFHWIEKLAKKLNAAIGASRTAVDAGLLSNDFQIGQTGKMIAPKLYLAIGISGAIQHLAGIKTSQTVVAINQDEKAPIFQIADYGFVGKVEEILPALVCE